MATAAVAPCPTTTSDDELLALWLYGRPEHTVTAYRADVKRLRAMYSKPFAEITLTDLQVFAESLSHLADSSKYRILCGLKSLFSFGYETGVLPRDISRMLRLPPLPNVLAEHIIPEADLHRMLALETNERNRVLLTLLYASGVRCGELANLRWCAFQATGDSGQITVIGKGNKIRSIALPASLWAQLRQLRGASGLNDPVFVAQTGGPISSHHIWYIVRSAAKQAGIDLAVSPHWLRHAHASHALDRGAPIHLVMRTLGHASIATTGKYLHARPKESSSTFLAL